MTENASLEDFLAGVESEATEPSGRSGPEDGRGGSVESEAPAPGDDANARDGEPVAEKPRTASDADGREVEPATSTYGWGRYDCSACGASLDRVWCEDERVVCGECKSW